MPKPEGETMGQAKHRAAEITKLKEADSGGRFKEVVMKLPRDFRSIDATEGTRAYEYLTRALPSSVLTVDPELLFIMDDKSPEGGLLYVFKDHSSVAFTPRTVH